MQKNLGLLDRLLRVVLAALVLFAAALLFKHPVARFLALASGLWALGEAFTAKCLLVSHLGAKSPLERLNDGALRLIGVVGVQMVLAYEWWSAGWGKLSNPEFVANIEKTFGYFASQNPFAWYKNFLLGFAMDRATGFAYAVEWSQVVISLALLVSGVVYVYSRNAGYQRAALGGAILALLGGALMNANFYLASGWTSPGAKGPNVVMFWTQIVLLYVWIISYRNSRLAGQP